MFLIILAVTNDMIVIGALKNILADLLLQSRFSTLTKRGTISLVGDVEGAVPYDFRQQTLLLFGTYRQKYAPNKS